jgi:hypothetical protein
MSFEADGQVLLSTQGNSSLWFLLFAVVFPLSKTHAVQPYPYCQRNNGSCFNLKHSNVLVQSC